MTSARVFIVEIHKEFDHCQFIAGAFSTQEKAEAYVAHWKPKYGKSTTFDISGYGLDEDDSSGRED